MPYTKICKRSELKEGEPKPFQLHGKDIVLLLSKNKVFAFDRWCTHEQGDMSQGTVEEGVITCPDHGSQFDLGRKGLNVLGPDGDDAGSVPDLPVFDVNIQGDDVFVNL